MLCILFFTLFLFIARPSFSDEGGWAATYGGETLDDARSLCETSDGGYIVAGWTVSFGARGADAWVLKLRPDGTIEWQKAYGGADSDWAYSLHSTIEGGYIVAGRTESFSAGAYDLWVLKLRLDGTIEWQKFYGGADLDWAESIQQTREGGYIVAGKTLSFGAGAYDFWLIKLGSNGTIEWQKTYGDEYEDWPHSIQQTSDGGYVVVGSLTSRSSCDGASVLKFGPDGGVQWQKTYMGFSWVSGSSILQTSDGGYIVAGCMTPFSKGSSDVLIFKLRADGTMEWQKTYGGDLDESASSIMQTQDGGYVVAGWIADSQNWKSFDFLFLKLRTDGSISPACNLVKDTILVVEDTSVIVESTSRSPINSNATPQDSSATAQDTNALAKFLCP